MNEIKVGVIGAGHWGKNLIRNFYELGVLKAIVESDIKVLTKYTVNQQYRDVIKATDSECFYDDGISAYVIATPAETHYEIAKKLLLRGKHVFVEKPFVLEIKHAKELIDIAKRKKRVLMVGHLLHYHPAFIKLKDLVRKGELGKIRYVYTSRLNFGKFRQNENSLWSFAPHDISMILELIDEKLEEVTANGSYYVQPGIADVTTTHLRFSSGVNAHIFVSWLHPYKEQKLIVIGEKKMAVFNDMEPLESKLILYSYKVNWFQGNPTPIKSKGESIVIEDTEPLRIECEAFLRNIEYDLMPITDGKEGLRVLQVLKTAQESLDVVQSKGG